MTTLGSEALQEEYSYGVMIPCIAEKKSHHARKMEVRTDGLGDMQVPSPKAWEQAWVQATDTIDLLLEGN